MKLSKLYSNQPRQFAPVEFNPGLNVVLAEIRLPENKKKDTHNLGKSIFGRLLDFMFLLSRNADFFLFKHFELFKSFVFLLEIELQDGSFLTVRRSVAAASKVSFKKHPARNQDFADVAESEWDHADLPFERSISMLDSLLDWRTLKPWSFRNVIGYLLRSQDDFSSVFHLSKFVGSHSEWKPFLAHILGFDDELITLHYRKEEEVAAKESLVQTIKAELGGSLEDLSKVEGLLLLKKQDADKKQKLLDSFDFRTQDKKRNKQLVDEFDEKIAALNSERYSLSQAKKKIVASLEEDQILFNPDEAKKLFQETGIFFEGQIKKDFEQLIAFNRAISEERRGYLEEEKDEIDQKLKSINSELNTLGKRRAETLSFLSSTDIFEKFRQVSDELVLLRAEIVSLQRQKGFLEKLQLHRTEARMLAEERIRLQAQIEVNVESQNSDTNSLFSTIRLFFSEIVEEVIDRKALLSVAPNKLGHLEFKAEILDESDNPTSADVGHSYRKLLCIAFDMAVLRANLGKRFPQFIYHDGPFESLDDRKKESLLAILREYAELGVQPIITLIDSDLPTRDPKNLPVFAKDEIVLHLNDEGDQGRLFKMKSW